MHIFLYLCKPCPQADFSAEIFQMFTLPSFYNIIVISFGCGGKALNINQIYDELSLRIDKNKMILNAPMKEYTSFKAAETPICLCSREAWASCRMH
jgi:hypothetical protein